MKFKTTIKNKSRLINKLKKLSKAAQTPVKKAVLTNGLFLQGDIKRMIANGGRSGVSYERGGISSIRSAPGEPPKTDSGNLVGSIQFRLTDSGFSGEVYTNSVYARALEFGFAPNNLAARPFMQPGFERNKDKVVKKIGHVTKIALRSKL